MVRMNRLGTFFFFSTALFSAVVLTLTSMGRADTPKDILDQKRQQEATKLATEDVVERITTVLRVMEYYLPDKAEQRKTLERVAGTLLGLSKTQMGEVLLRLDRASLETDPGKSTKELAEAHARHIEIMQSLKTLLAEYETISTLDQIADKLDKMAKTELELSLTSNKLIQDQENLSANRGLLGGGFGGGKGMRSFSPLVTASQNLKQLSAEQDNLQKDLVGLLKKADDLKTKLPAEQKGLLEQLNAAVDDTRVVSTLKKANLKLDDIDNAFSGDQVERLRDTNLLQRRAADDMKDLASVLRQGKDELSALRRAQDQLDESIRQQEDLQEKSKELADKDTKDPPRKFELLDIPQFRGGKKGGGGFGKNFNDTPLMLPEDDRGAKVLSDQQARLGLDTRETSNLLKPFVKELADQIDTARAPMKSAEDAIRDRTANKAVEPQDKALDLLKDARAKVADMIAKAELKRNDPLAAIQNALETVEKLLKEQIETRDLTKDAGDNKEMSKLPEIAPQQQDLANRTEILNSLPLPTKKETQQALDKATKAMENAAKNLEKQKADNAVAKQNDAIKSLQDASKDLQKQIAEMEKRREDIAKLEAASQKLDKLTRDETKISDQAKDRSQETKANTKALAKDQGQLTPQAKSLAKDLDKIVPKAADEVNKGAKNMDAAKKELDKNQAKPGAQEAKQAVDRLKDAQAELNKKLDDLKAKEFADQAAMKNADPNVAMQQLQKAMDQTQQAMKEAQKAMDQAAQKSLAELQKRLADEAKQQNLDKAALPANNAAKALQKGDLAKAIDSQKQALDKFQQANPKGDKSQQPATAKQGDPDQGQQGDAKQGQEPGEKGQKAAEAKPGDKGQQGKGKTGQSPDAQAKAGQKGEAKTAGQATPGQLADRQQELIDATKQLAQQQAQRAQQSQQSTKGAMQALGQAMAGTPQGAQQQMQQAAGQLGQAGQQLGQGSPGQAQQSQQKAFNQMQQAMNQMKGAQAAQAKQGQGKQPGDGKGQKGQKAQDEPQDGKDGKDGKGQKAGKGEKGKGQKQGQGDKQGEGKKQGQPGAQEKNNNKGDGNRIADGKEANAQAVIRDVTGTDSFLQLPPRQRELIRQALAGELPPEYASQIQQYYLNISRGKSGVMPPPPK